MTEAAAVASVVGAIVTLIIGALTYISTRGKTQTEARTAQEVRIDARVDKIMEADRVRIEKLEGTVEEQEGEIAELRDKVGKQEDEIRGWRRRWGAVGRVFRALAAQWPGDDMPRLDPLDLAEIEDTIPPQWLRDHPSSPKGSS